MEATSALVPSTTILCMRMNETKGKNPNGLNREDKTPPPKRINLIDKLISKSLLNDDFINDIHRFH